MALIGISGVTLTHGGPPILDGVSLQIDEGERLGLLGRNASGKSTLMGVITGDVAPDDGTVSIRQGVTWARLQQEVPRGLSGTVLEVVSGGFRGGEEPWRTKERLERLFEGLQLAPDADVSTLSAGLSRRVLLARALASSPDVLLLDEPTNHLDLPSIQWLESHLLERRGATLFVTHDRAFLRRLATRILEIDRGKLTSWPGDYDNYLRRKQERTDDESHRREQSDKLLAKEEVWRRKGLKAQRNRNQSRVEQLERLRQERRDRRDPTGSVKLSISEADRSGRLVFEAKGLTAGHGTKSVVRGLDLLVMRGDRIGLVGPNGSGKTTLLRTLLGELPPLAGTVRRGHEPRADLVRPPERAPRPRQDGRRERDRRHGRDRVRGEAPARDGVPLRLPLRDRPRPPARQAPLGRRAGAPPPRAPLRAAEQRPRARRADERPRRGDARPARGRDPRLSGHRARREPRPRFPRPDRDGPPRLRREGRRARGRRRLERVGADPPEAARPRPRRPRRSRPSEAGPAPRSSNRDRKELEKVEKKIATLEDEQRALHAKMEVPDFWTGPIDRIDETKDRLAAVEKEIEVAYERWTALQA